MWNWYNQSSTNQTRSQKQVMTATLSTANSVKTDPPTATHLPRWLQSSGQLGGAILCTSLLSSTGRSSLQVPGISPGVYRHALCFTCVFRIWGHLPSSVCICIKKHKIHKCLNTIIYIYIYICIYRHPHWHIDFKWFYMIHIYIYKYTYM